MRVLFADDLPPACIEGARAAGYECAVQDGLNPENLPSAIPGFDVVVVRSTKVTAEAIAAGDALGLIIRAGAGTNTIDVEAAANAAVQVANVPGQNAIAVAELTMGLLLAIDRRIAESVIDSRRGHWNKETYSKGRGLFGRTMGIIGLGSIGLAVAQRARAFGMEVLVVARPDRDARRLEKLEALGVQQVETQPELLARSDVVSIHVPGAPETEGMVDAEFLSQLKPGSILINTSRGDTIDEAPLLEALDSKDLWVALDVYPSEPAFGQGEFRSELAAHPRVYGTHHIGASTAQAQEAVGDAVVELLEAFADGTELPNVVNLKESGTAASTLVVRHRNRVGVLRDVLSVLRGAGLNVEDMINRIFEGGGAAVATIHVGGEPKPEVLDGVREVENVLSVSVSS